MPVDAEMGAEVPFAKEMRIGQTAAAVLVLLACAFPALLTALLVWLSVGRPLLFRQLRSGLNGGTFTIVKFRTMHERRDADGKLLPDGERLTTATRLIRAIRMDEIPQLIAIAAGTMNFIGPRPLPPAVLKGFGELAAERCRVRPGLTGWSQVNGNTRLSDDEKLALDIWYIDNRSALLDACILMKTALTLLRGERVHEGHVADALGHLRARPRRTNLTKRQSGNVSCGSPS
jgi:lipopolysaccharide/colanic/teichoic acid biosynthesis glycosyltransferase